MPQNTSRGYTYPLYTDGTDFPAQIQELATDIDTDMDQLFDRVIAGNIQAACSIESTVVQAVANNTDVTATWATETYDNDAMVNLGVSNTTVNLNDSGIYIASVRVTMNTNGNGEGRQVSIVTTGTLGTVGRKSIQGETGAGVAVNLTSLFYSAGGTTLTVVMRQNSGLSLNALSRKLQVAKVSTL